jgi:Fe-Mn family superoxide dismutase
MFKLPKLPYKLDGLEPYISADTINFHFNKHHFGYVVTVNDMLPGSGIDNVSTLEEVIVMSSRDVKLNTLFNNAAQVWNHSFYWCSLIVDRNKNSPSLIVLDRINKSFGSLGALREKIVYCAVSQFGSGWVWLIEKNDGMLDVINTSNAELPIQYAKALMCIDVWEHAYYLDEQNKRASYIDKVISIIDWSFVELNLSRKDNMHFFESLE